MSLFDAPLEAPSPTPARPVEAEPMDPGALLTHGAYIEGLKILNPLIYAADANAADGNAAAYWTILHGNPFPHTEPSERLRWVTNGVWGELCIRILRTCAKMPKPSELEALLLLQKPKEAPEERKALPATGTITQRSGTIRTQNMRLLRDFQRACTEYGESLMGKNRVRSRLLADAQREGLTGDVLRLTVAIRLQEHIMGAERPVMPIFLRDGGYPSAESSAKADRWNQKEDVAQSLRALRAELAAAIAEAE